MTNLLALLVLSTVPFEMVRNYEEVDVIERNCVVGRFIQVIFRDVDGSIMHWHMCPLDGLEKLPDNIWVWKENGKVYQIKYRKYVETNTTYDPEVLERTFLPERFRRHLRSADEIGWP